MVSLKVRNAIRSGENMVKQILAVIGAGMSASAGIPPFRNQNGDWQTGESIRKALDINEYMTKPQARRTLWDWIHDADIVSKKPTPAHLALRKLYDYGALSGVLTQNIDGLEFKAGIPESKVWQVHGSLSDSFCQRCFKAYNTGSILDLLYSDGHKTGMDDCSYSASGMTVAEVDSTVLHCHEWNHKKDKPCGGVIKPGIVFYGENIRQEAWKNALGALWFVDEVWILGTSLNVYPVADLPRKAVSIGKPVRIVTTGHVSLGDIASKCSVVHGTTDEVVPELVDDIIGSVHVSEDGDEL